MSVKSKTLKHWTTVNTVTKMPPNV
uniref:Uncharacterized protein n=1 Tax=Anguilla anguilla TaxID=7936 RepID=A0A0E9SYY2_ANGAN